MVWLIFAAMIITGFGKAMRDTIAHHFSRSVFADVRSQRMFKWFQSDYRDFKLHYGLFRLDAWHVADFVMFVGVMLAVALSALVQDPWLSVFYFGGSMVFFNLFYKIVLLKKRGAR